MWATGVGLQKGQRGPGKVLPGLWEGEAEVCGVSMGRRGWAEQNADGGVSGVGKGVSGGDEGVQGGVAEVKKVVEKGLKNVARASHSWHWTPIGDTLNYVEWWAGFPQEEIEEEYQELWREDLMYWEYLKEKQVDKEKSDELVTTTFKDYKLEEGEEERGDGLEEWVPEVDLEE